MKPRPERIISSRPSAAAALTGAFCGTMARSSVGDGHKRGSWSRSGWTMTSTTVFKFTAHEHRNLLCRCPQHRIPGGRRHRADTITSATHAVDELVCNTSYEFRVSAYADGDTYKDE